jgi:hypothetical protein
MTTNIPRASTDRDNVSPPAAPHKGGLAHPAPASLKLLSRRSVMNALVSVASVASAGAVTPSIAASSSGEFTYPDLASRFAAVYARWREQRARDEAQQRQVDRRIEAETGLSRADEPSPGDAGFGHYDAIARRIVSEIPEGGEKRWDVIHDEMFPLCRDILQRPAHSLTDLGLQARAFALINSEGWKPCNGIPCPSETH